MLVKFLSFGSGMVFLRIRMTGTMITGQSDTKKRAVVIDLFLKLCESLTVVHIYLCSFSG